MYTVKHPAHSGERGDLRGVMTLPPPPPHATSRDAMEEEEEVEEVGIGSW